MERASYSEGRGHIGITAAVEKPLESSFRMAGINAGIRHPLLLRRHEGSGRSSLTDIN